MGCVLKIINLTNEILFSGNKSSIDATLATKGNSRRKVQHSVARVLHFVLWRRPRNLLLDSPYLQVHSIDITDTTKGTFEHAVKKCMGERNIHI